MNKIIDLGMHPYADTFIAESQLGLSEPVYPLECWMDEENGEIRLKYKTDPDDRYSLYNYSYTSSNSKFSRGHWDKYAKHTSEKINLKPNAHIIEIGSNDGYLAEQYQKAGHRVLGVDPSKYMAEIAKSRGVDTYCNLFSEAASGEIKKKYGPVDCIVANNVFNHADDPLDFAKGVKNLLQDDGVFIFEVPYWYNTIVDGRFDQIYHEHVSYFTVKYSCNLLERAGLTIFDVEVVDYHGGSIRVYSKKKPDSVSANVGRLIRKETDAGIFEPEMYSDFVKRIKNKRSLFMERLHSVAREGKPIIGIGAAAKANTFLNFYNIDSTIMEYVTDASEHKIGKYTPLTRIPILDDKTVLKKYEEVYAVILSWNITDILEEKLRRLNSNITFLSTEC